MNVTVDMSRGPSSFIPPSEVSKPTPTLTIDSAYLHAGVPRQRVEPNNQN